MRDDLNLKEEVGEGLVRRCVAEGIGKRLEAKGVKEMPEFIGLDEFSVRGATSISHGHL